MLVKKIDRRNGEWMWEYDDELNPTKETDPLKRVTTHTYNKMSKRLSTTDAENRTTSFEYDKLYRMTQVTDPAAASTLTSTIPTATCSPSPIR
jgi:YD repeat-containing protein